MASAVDIANMALIECGAESITALSDANERARACNAAWPIVRRLVLSMHSWNYPTKRALLDPDATPPLWEFANRYPIPADCIRVLDVDSDLEWRVEGAWLLTDEGGDDLGVRYIYDETDPAGFPPGLTNALVVGLAYRVMHRLNADIQLRDRIERQWVAFQKEAQNADGQEQSESLFEDDTWLACRW